MTHDRLRLAGKLTRGSGKDPLGATRAPSIVGPRLKKAPSPAMRHAWDRGCCARTRTSKRAHIATVRHQTWANRCTCASKQMRHVAKEPQAASHQRGQLAQRPHGHAQALTSGGKESDPTLKTKRAHSENQGSAGDHQLSLIMQPIAKIGKTAKKQNCRR